MGILTGVGTEREHERDGKKTAMNVIELDMDGYSYFSFIYYYIVLL